MMTMAGSVVRASKGRQSDGQGLRLANSNAGRAVMRMPVVVWVGEQLSRVKMNAVVARHCAPLPFVRSSTTLLPLALPPSAQAYQAAFSQHVVLHKSCV